MDKELQRQLRLTTEDLRFMDNIRKRVDETVAAGEFLEATGKESYRLRFVLFPIRTVGRRRCISLT